MSDTGAFQLTPVFDGMIADLGPDHAIFELDPAAVLDTDTDSEIPPDDLLPVAA